MTQKKTLLIEVWAALVYNGIKYENYQVSNYGKIRSIERFVTRKNRWNTTYKQFYPSRLLIARTNGIEDLLFCDVWIDRKPTTVYIHKAVYENFGGIKKDYVSHRNFNNQDNMITNLYPISHSELQIRNMKLNPMARMRLALANHKSGYYKNGSNGRKPLDNNVIRMIRKLHKQSRTAKEIAKFTGLSVGSVYKYRNT